MAGAGLRDVFCPMNGLCPPHAHLRGARQGLALNRDRVRAKEPLDERPGLCRQTEATGRAQVPLRGDALQESAHLVTEAETLRGPAASKLENQESRWNNSIQSEGLSTWGPVSPRGCESQSASHSQEHR